VELNLLPDVLPELKDDPELPLVLENLDAEEPPVLDPNDAAPWFLELMEVNLVPDVLPEDAEDPALALKLADAESELPEIDPNDPPWFTETADPNPDPSVLPEENVDPVLPLELPPNDTAPFLADEEDNALKDDPNFLPEEKHPAQSWPSPLITADDEPIFDAEIPELKLPDDPVEVNLEPEESPLLPLELANPEEPPELAPFDAKPPELTANEDDPWLTELVEVNLESDVLPEDVEDPALAPRPANPETELPEIVPNDAP